MKNRIDVVSLEADKDRPTFMMVEKVNTETEPILETKSIIKNPFFPRNSFGRATHIVA
jgi:hypothetical protein